LGTISAKGEKLTLSEKCHQQIGEHHSYQFNIGHCDNGWFNSGFMRNFLL
jgi:hypothetical protein